MRRRVAAVRNDVPYLPKKRIEDEANLVLAEWGQNRALVFDARYIRRAHLLMRSEGLAGVIMFHSHPMSDTLVGFSVYDDHQEPQLIANLREIAPVTQLVSVVASKRAQCGRVWTGHSGPEALGRLITVGEALGFHALSGEPELAAPPPAPAG